MDARKGWVALPALALLMGGAAWAQPPAGMVQTETIVAEQRTSVSVRISQAAADAFMPKGWVASQPALTMIFMDRKLQLDPAGQPLQSGANQLLVLSVGGRNVATGETKYLIVGGVSSDPLGVPGAYKVFGNGEVSVARAEASSVKDGKIVFAVTEAWRVKAADGSTLEADVAFTRGLPNSANFEQKVWSGADPDFYRFYRGAQATDVVRNAQGVNRGGVRLKASGGKLGAAINGTEVVTGITNTPVYSRQTFVVAK